MKRKCIRTFIAACACGTMFLNACAQTAAPQGEKSSAAAQAEQTSAAAGQNGNEAETTELNGQKHNHSIEKKKMNFVFCMPGSIREQEYEFAFEDDAEDIPYISVETFRDMYVALLKETDVPNADITIEKDGQKVTLYRETKYPMRIDFLENTIEFYDYDAFLRKLEKQPLIDVTTVLGVGEGKEPEYFKLSDSSFERYGEKVTFRPGDYGIDLIEKDGEYYIPLQLVSDIIFSDSSYNTLFNGKEVFLIGGQNVADVADRYYIADAPKERSDALIEFNYNELCFALDALYGLKSQHNIKNFDALFWQTGLADRLKSKDPQEAGQALADLTFKFLDDMHTGATVISYMMKDEFTRNIGPSSQQSLAEKARYVEARSKYYPDGPVPYEEVGNTAFITFDDFLYLAEDYYGGEKPEDHLDDTTGLMLYAYERITRENSPIENVVLDLSNNGGGMADAAAYVIGAFLGDGTICISNPLTGALVNENYKVDLNLDRQFDEKDSLKDYHLFCLTSNRSFSCGNLVPCVLQNSRRVALIGQQSGGGACVVRTMSTADGCMFQMSGVKRLAYMKNGSFYDIDRGATPDFAIANPELLYDRKYMAKYVNQLVGK